jgi:hypothetical protein
MNIGAVADLTELEAVIADKEGVPAHGRAVSTHTPMSELEGATVHLSLGLCGGGRSRGKGKKAANFFGPVDEPDGKLLAAREKWKEKHGDGEDGDDSDDEEAYVAPVKKKSSKPVVLDQYGTLRDRAGMHRCDEAARYGVWYCLSGCINRMSPALLFHLPGNDHVVRSKPGARVWTCLCANVNAPNQSNHFQGFRSLTAKKKVKRRRTQPAVRLLEAVRGR